MSSATSANYTSGSYPVHITSFYYVAGAATGDVVYLYDAEGNHGDAKYAFRSVRFINPTTSTLETGPVTVYGSGRFIGEGLTDPIPPGATQRSRVCDCHTVEAQGTTPLT